MRVVELSGDGEAPRSVRLRPITGRDELAVTAYDYSSVHGLVSRLASGSSGPALDLGQLTVSEIDRLLAALYDMLYGDSAECRVRCGGCGEAYEFTLSLSQMIAAQDAERPDPPDADGAWTLPDGRRVRAPRLEDLEVAGTPGALLERLLLSSDAPADTEALSAFLERAAPVLSLDLDAACPHCAAAERVRFDLAHYLAARLAGERPFLVRETHLIASRYGWSHGEIMDLSRDDRRAYAGLIEAERASAQRPRKAG